MPHWIQSGPSDQQKSLQKILGSRYWAQPLPYLDIQEHLESRKPEESFILSSASVRLVGQIWASRSLPQRRCCSDYFSNGALIREDPPGCLVEAEEDFSISAIQSIDDGDWAETGNRL